MHTLVEKFTRLKTSVSGNREKTQYEETNFVTPEELHRITPLGRWQFRILSELEFALKLCKDNGQWAPCLEAALDGLQRALEEQGTFTKADALAAEQTLHPMAAAAKDYELILAGHAHIDMNWMWSWQETVTATLETFRTTLAIMDEYPQFCFSQSQAAVYRIVEEYEPEMMEPIRRRIAEGRWEVTASAWVETDKNMPSTESLVRHILYTKNYLQKTWGVDPASLDIDFSPDTFGHSGCLPELNNHGGVKYYYHCRGLDGGDCLFRWRGPSGAEVLVYREPYWYNGSITPHIGTGIVDLARACGGLKTGLIVYGIGDHGGGPTRKDIQRAVDMGTWPIYPVVRFGSIREYFQKAEAVRHKLKVVEQELNFTFTGCYTTQGRLKRGNRVSEALLGEAEAYNGLATTLVGAPYRQQCYEQAWRNVLFTHFHDILTGSCVRDSREHAMGLFSEAQAIANTGRAAALRAIAQRTDTSWVRGADRMTMKSEGGGAGYVGPTGLAVSAERGGGITRVFQVFNPSPQPRRCVTELTVWDWDGDMRRMCFRDAQGQPVVHQLLDQSPLTYWDHRYFRVLVETDLPALGYGVWVMEEAPADEYPVHYHPQMRTSHAFDNYVLENECLRAEFDRRSAGLLSLIDKATGQEWIEAGDAAGLRLIDTEPDSSSAWNIGRYIAVEKLNRNLRVAARLQEGALRQMLEVEVPFRGSVARLAIGLDKGSAALRCAMQIDWQEISRDKQQPVPALVYALPLAHPAENYLFDVPAGVARRPAQNIDVPGLQYGAAVWGNRALALVTDSKYGYRADEQGIAVTLLHAPGYPDPDPERGEHEIVVSVALADAQPKALEELARKINHPPVFLPVKPHIGDLPPVASLLELRGNTTAVISGIKEAEDGQGIIVRLYNVSAEATVARLTFRQRPQAATPVDALEQPVAVEIALRENTVEVPLLGYCMGAVKVSF